MPLPGMSGGAWARSMWSPLWYLRRSGENAGPGNARVDHQVGSQFLLLGLEGYMSPGSSAGPYFRIRSRSFQMVPGMVVHGYFAVASLELWVEDDSPHFHQMPFQLDSKSDITTVPE